MASLQQVGFGLTIALQSAAFSYRLWASWETGSDEQPPRELQSVTLGLALTIRRKSFLLHRREGGRSNSCDVVSFPGLTVLG